MQDSLKPDFYFRCHNKKCNLSNKSMELLRASNHGPLLWAVVHDLTHKIQTLGYTKAVEGLGTI